MLHIHAAVNDGNHLAVAGIRAAVSPHHGKRVGIFVILLLILRNGKDRLHINGVHRVQGRNVLQEAILHICGKAVHDLIVIIPHSKGAGCRIFCRSVDRIR